VPGDDAVQVVVGSGISHIAAELDETLRTYHLQRVMRLEANPYLQDHVVDGKAVLPMASAMSWICNTAEGLYPGYRVFNFDDYRVLKGIIFDETLADKYTLVITEQEKSDDTIHVDVMASSQPSGARMPRYHYKTSLTLTPKIPPMPTYANMDLTPSLDIPGEQFYEDYTLFHGFAFKGVDRVLNIRKGHITLRCHLPVVPPRYQGQFPVQSFNYFMTDIGFQSMGIYAKHFYKAGSLPLRAGHGDHYADVPWGEVFYVSLEVHQESDTGLVTTLYIHDEDGKLYMQVDSGEITISTRLNDLFRRNRLPQPLA